MVVATVLLNCNRATLAPRTAGVLRDQRARLVAEALCRGSRRANGLCDLTASAFEGANGRAQRLHIATKLFRRALSAAQLVIDSKAGIATRFQLGTDAARSLASASD